LNNLEKYKGLKPKGSFSKRASILSRPSILSKEFNAVHNSEK